MDWTTFWATFSKTHLVTLIFSLVTADVFHFGHSEVPMKPTNLSAVSWQKNWANNNAVFTASQPIPYLNTT
jgi:hypothetical protein